MRITNTQKKELADIFRETGLNLLDFETSGEYKEFKVKFKYDYFSFSIELRSPNDYILMIRPIDNKAGYNRAVTWEQTKSIFKDWVTSIAVELNTSTGWETFQSENFLNAGYEELEQTFSDKEKIETRQAIAELKERIKTLELSNNNHNIINLKLDELSAKIDELKKFDWKSLFVGTIASLIMTLGIPPEASGLLWEFIKTAFSGLKLNG